MIEVKQPCGCVRLADGEYYPLEQIEAAVRTATGSPTANNSQQSSQQEALPVLPVPEMDFSDRNFPESKRSITEINADRIRSLSTTPQQSSVQNPALKSHGGGGEYPILPVPTMNF